MVYKINGNLDNMVFKKIEGYEDYLIRGNGDVYSLKGKKARKLKPAVVGKCRNYLAVSLCKNGIQKTFKIHRLVAQAFIPNPYGFDTVDHIDGNTKNNCISNLQYLSRGDNTRKYYGKALKDIQEA